MKSNLKPLSEYINLEKLEFLQSSSQIDKVSISILGLDSLDSCIYSVNGNLPRYPASIIKLFWAVQALIQLPESNAFDSLLEAMIVDSSDSAGQQIVDLLCGQQDPSSVKDFEEAYFQRTKLETFWKEHGYKNLKAAHKTFLNEYSEFDDWIKRNKFQNSVTSDLVIDLWKQLWFEASTLGLTDKHRTKLLNWLCRKPTKEKLKPEENGFQSSLLGYALPPEAVFHGKSGWRDDTINDSGIIVGNKKFAIVVLSELGEKEGIALMRSILRK